MSKMRDDIMELLKSDITAYRIAKETGINPATIQTLRLGGTKLDNTSFKNAEKLAEYAKNNLKKS